MYKLVKLCEFTVIILKKKDSQHNAISGNHEAGVETIAKKTGNVVSLAVNEDMGNYTEQMCSNRPFET